MTLSENFMSVIRNVFPVEDLSLPPYKASRSDNEFVEVAWLLNRYRSLWYEIRRNEFQKYLRHKKKGLSAEFIQRVEEAIQFTNDRFQHHASLYHEYYKVLEKHQPGMDVGRQIHVFENEGFEKIPCTVSKQRNHSPTEIDAILSLGGQLVALTRNLLRRQKSAVKEVDSIRTFLAPARMTPNENFMSNFRNFFPVNELSLPPDKAPRSDREFMELAWLLNRYRSLWFEKRHYDFSNFLRHRKQGLKAKLVQRVEEAAEFTKKGFQKYESLYRDYYKILETFHSEGIVNLPSDLVGPGRELQISEDDDGLEQDHCRGKRKRKIMKLVRKAVSQGNHQTREYQYSGEYLEDLRSHSPRIDARDGLKGVAVDANADLSKEVEHTSLFMEEFQDSTIALPADCDLQFGKPSNSQQLYPNTDNDDELLQVLYQAALQGCAIHGLNTNNEDPSTASSEAVEHCQLDGSLLVEKQQATQAMEVRDQEEVRVEPEPEKDFSYDEEFLKFLHQPALGNCEFDGFIPDNEGLSPTTIDPVEHCQPDESSVSHDKQLETEATEVVEQEELRVEAGFENYFSYDEEFLQVLYQPALENCKSDGGISDTARTVAVEHCQPDNSSPNGGQQLETDILEVTNDRFQCFESLPHDYYKTSEEFQSEKVVNDPYFPFSSDFMEIDGQIRICQAQDLEQKQMNGNQGRAKLNGFRNLISVGGQEKADNQLVEGANPNIQPSILDDLRNLQSDHTVPDDLEAPEVMSTHVNSRKIDGGICRAKRCKFLEADIQTKPHEAEQRKYSDEEQETRKRLEDTMENHSIVYKRSKVSSQTDDYRVTSVVTSRDAYGSTSEKYVERLDSPTA